MASFLLFSLSVFAFQKAPYIPNAQLAEISGTLQWQSLLHMKDGKSLIDDPKFILSSGNFSPINELVETIKLFQEQPSSVCHFPARYHLIAKYRTEELSKIKLDQCEDYKEFKRKAPIDSLSLIYASENLTQPSSAMGHIMLKMSGKNDQNVAVEHGVSFFTELDTINIPKIILDTLIVGKRGYFQVSPYEEKLDYYQNTEQRNVWEYTLNASREQLELVHDHIWELKTADLKYFFDRYNCATVTQALLNVTFPKQVEFKQNWLTPIDVVKEAAGANIVSQTLLHPSNKWKIRMLYNMVSDSTIETLSERQFAQIDFSQAESNVSKYLNFEMASSLNNFDYQQGDLSLEQWTNNYDLLNTANGDKTDYFLDLSQYKSPLKKPEDSQISVGYVSKNSESFTNFKLLPASHCLEDDNRQYFGEAELKLMEFSVLIDNESGEVDLDEWNLYSTKSYVPWNPLTGGLSGEINISLNNHYDGNLEDLRVFNLSGGLGLTHRISSDISAFYLALAGMAANDQEAFLFGGVKVGAYVHEIFDMKTFVTFSQVFNEGNSRGYLDKWNLTQSFYHFKNISAYMNIETVKGEGAYSEIISLNMKHLF